MSTSNDTSRTRSFDAYLNAGETALSLVQQQDEVASHLCDPWAFEGLNLIAGRPKLGKTTLVRQKLHAAASGAMFLGERFEPCDCLFLCLEEGRHLLRKKLLAQPFSETALARIDVKYQWPRGPEGVLALSEYLHRHPQVRYVAVDTLARFRSAPKAKAQGFMEDYEALAGLQGVGKQFSGLSLDVTTHTRKHVSGDPMDDISGTYGLTAAIDSFWVLRRTSEGAALHVGGRWWEHEKSAFSLRRENGGYVLPGGHLPLSQKQMETYAQLGELKRLTPSQLGELLDISKQSAHERLQALEDKGFAKSVAGVYYLNTP